MKNLFLINIFLFLLVFAPLTFGADITVDLISQGFESPGPESGWGFYLIPSGSSSTSMDWADNGPSLPGGECAYCYSLVDPNATTYCIYANNLALPVLEQLPFKEFNVEIDVKNSWEGAYTYWYFWATFEDDTQQSFLAGAYYVYGAGTWSKLSAVHTLSPENQDKVVKSVKISVYVNPSNVPGRNTCFDNIIIKGVRGPQNCEEVTNQGYYLDSDLNGDCSVDFGDIDSLATEWLRCFDPEEAGCEKPWL